MGEKQNIQAPAPILELPNFWTAAAEVMSAESSIDDLRSKLVGRLQEDRELRGHIRKMEKTCQHEWVVKEGFTDRRCLLCGKKDKVREPNFVQCEICPEGKWLTPGVKVNGWWAIRQKKGGGFESAPVKATGLKAGERAACGIGHLMVLCERAAHGSLDKTVYPDNKQKPVGLTEATALGGEDTTMSTQQFESLPPGQSIVASTLAGTPVLDDVPPDPTILLEPDIPVLRASVTKFHALPFLVRLVNKHVFPPLDEFPSTEPQMGVWET